MLILTITTGIPFLSGSVMKSCIIKSAQNEQPVLINEPTRSVKFISDFRHFL